MSDWFEVLKWVVLTVVGLLGAGVYTRRVLSRDKVGRAQDAAEASIFGTSMAETRMDRDAWKASCDEAWRRLREVESKYNATKARNLFLESQMTLIERLVRRNPILKRELPFVISAPGALGPPSEPPTLPGNFDERTG